MPPGRIVWTDAATNPRRDQWREDNAEQVLEERRKVDAFRQYKALLDARRQQAADARAAEAWERQKRKQVIDYYQDKEKTAYEREQARLDRERQAMLDQRAAETTGLTNKGLLLGQQKTQLDIERERREEGLRSDPLRKAIANVAMGLPQSAGRDPAKDGGIGGTLTMNKDGSMTFAKADGSRATISREYVEGEVAADRGINVGSTRQPQPAYQAITPAQRGLLLNKVEGMISYELPGQGIFATDLALKNRIQASLVDGALQGMTPRQMIGLIPPEAKPSFKAGLSEAMLDTPLVDAEAQQDEAAPQNGIERGLSNLNPPAEVRGIVSDADLAAMAPDLNGDGKISREEVDAEYQKALQMIQKADAVRQRNPDAFAKLNPATLQAVELAKKTKQAYESIYKKNAQARVEQGLNARR